MSLDYSAPVLIVDDEQVIVSVTKQILSKIGFEQIDHAFDAATALSMLFHKKYQLVISDLRMQPITGLQLLRAVRQDDQLRGTPFLLMTASHAPEPVMTAKLAGANAYLLKPFTPQQLRTKLDEIFG